MQDHSILFSGRQEEAQICAQILWYSVQNKNSVLTPSIVIGYKAALFGTSAGSTERKEKKGNTGQRKLCGSQS